MCWLATARRARRQKLFNLPMNDAFLMQILYGRNNLSKLSSSLFLLHAPMHNEIVEDFTARSVLHHQIEGLVGLNHLEKLDDVGVVEHFHDADLRKRKLSKMLCIATWTKIPLGTTSANSSG